MEAVPYFSGSLSPKVKSRHPPPQPKSESCLAGADCDKNLHASVQTVGSRAQLWCVYTAEAMCAPFEGSHSRICLRGAILHSSVGLLTRLHTFLSEALAALSSSLCCRPGTCGCLPTTCLSLLRRLQEDGNVCLLCLLPRTEPVRRHPVSIGWVGRWAGGWVDGRTGGRVGGWTCGRVARRAAGGTDRWVSGWWGGWLGE